MQLYENFDPLEATIFQGEDNKKIINEAKKREIRNILKCYTGYFDILAEPLQNALDATEKKFRKASSDYEPRIFVEINFHENSITVSDNGSGMNQNEFEYCLAPNISFKTFEDLRGNKGVGTTFLAYGYNNIKIHTKSPDFEARVMMLNGRTWVEDYSNDIERPTFNNLENNINNFLTSQESGTTFKVTLARGEKPNLGYISATTANQWLNILRIKTPLGGIYLTSTKEGQYKPNIVLKVFDFNGVESSVETKGADYLYPHEIPNLKVQSAGDIEKALIRIMGSPQEKFQKLNDSFKKLNAIYDIWDLNDLITNKDKISKGLEQSEIDILNENNICVYGFFCNSTRIFDRFNDDILKIRKNYRIMRGGLQMATDGMPQGELITIPLTRYIGYQEQTHVIVHFQNGEPDLGRKTFQKEKAELAEKLSKNVVEYLKQYRNHLKSDETSDPLTPDRERHDWIRDQELFLQRNPLNLSNYFKGIKIISKPQKEQDVIALFHELVGIGFIKGLEFLATSENERYDSIFKINYSDESFYYSDEQHLGVSPDVIPTVPFITEPKILEYKYDFDALVRECQSNEKYHKHINLVVAWNATLRNQDKVELKPLLIEESGKYNRSIYGSTHLAYLSGHYENHIYEVILLEDLLNYYYNQEEEIRNQFIKYVAN